MKINSTPNKDLKLIFDKDQSDRHDQSIRNNSKLLTGNDLVRKKIIRKMIASNELSSGEDYYMAGMIFHHGSSISDSVMAVKLLKKSCELSYEKGLSMYATCIDRLLIKRGKKQKFGTQYQKKNAKSKWKILSIDSSTTDEERKKYNIAPLKVLISHVEKLNK